MPDGEALDLLLQSVCQLDTGGEVFTAPSATSPMLALSESMFWLTSLAVAVCSSVAVDICALRWAIPSTAWAMRPSAFPASRARWTLTWACSPYARGIRSSRSRGDQ
ncbi:hypothetical protein AN456_07900 [Pseudomonas aeruginosa]|nr:hypothetical protein AN455_07930 [Pseudomonas aeruginosa]KRV15691.1 hypothetical protein AN456_07900 [Pseudomonas aeruginosa]